MTSDRHVLYAIGGYFA